MTNHGRLTLHEGLVSARIAPLALMDAAVSGELAGIELECEMVDVFVGPQATYRSTLTLDLSMRPSAMEALRDLLARRLPGPAFTEAEWRKLRNICIAQGDQGFADRIEEGLNAR